MRRRYAPGDTVLVKVDGRHYEVVVEAVTATGKHFRGIVPTGYTGDKNEPRWHDIERIEDSVQRRQEATA
jgi:hypothetical protein